MIPSTGKRNNIIPVTSAVQESQVTEDSEVTPGLFQGDIALSAVRRQSANEVNTVGEMCLFKRSYLPSIIYLKNAWSLSTNDLLIITIRTGKREES